MKAPTRPAHGREGSTSPMFALGLLWLSTALILNACGPDYPNCENDDHCKEKGEYCLETKCAQCRTSDHCPNAGNDKCVSCQAGACVRKKGCCASNLDCAKGLKCSAGKCTAECSSDEQCPAGRVCSESGACVSASDGCAQAGDCPAGLRCQKGRCINPDGACELVHVRFAFTESVLNRGAQAAIAANTKCLRERGATATVILQGHCDERGTDAYNLELGNRRAQAVRKYVGQIMPGTKVQTVSFGKTQPLCESTIEKCWSTNRRVEFHTSN